MSHDPLVQMAYCLFKCGKRHVVVENLAGGFEPARKGEMFWAISPVLRSVGQRSFKLHTHTKKKEIKEKTNIITLTNLKLLAIRSQGIIK